MKNYLICLVLFLSISLCGCNNGSDGQQIREGTSIIENGTDYKENLQNSDVAEEDMLSDVSELTGETEANETQSLGTIPELEELMFGNVGNLGLGSLVYTVPDKDDEDYRLYFFKLEKEEDRYLSLAERSFNLSEASYIFPDVREANVPIGKFKGIYCMDYTSSLKDGAYDVIVIAVYEKDGIEYYDTRVYEESEKGFIVDVALTQELNEKYYNVEDYPIGDIIILPGE